MPSDAAVLSVRGISKTFGQRRALDGVSLSVRAGEMIALIGPSGSGKSTLLRSLSGLVVIDDGGGEVVAFDVPVQARGRVSDRVREARVRMGFIFQQFNLVARLTLFSNAALGSLGRIGFWRGVFGLWPAETKAAAMAALTRVGVADYAGQRAGTLSGGQQQRGAIARALVQQAKIILADEPVASLDPVSARRVMEILAELNREDGMTVVVSLHQVDYAQRYCQRVVALKAGKIVYDGAADGLDRPTLIDIYGPEFEDVFWEGSARMISRRNFGFSSLAALGLAACGPSETEAPGEITFSILPTGPAATLQKNWQPVLDDMAKLTGLKVKPFIPSNYTVLIEAMKFKQSDAGWFSNETGLEAVRRANGEVFARTLGPNGVNGYQSVLIVNAKSGITLDRILKCDKTLSFGQADPLSTSGYVAPIAFFFGPNNIQPENCFSTIRTSNHNTNLLAVASGTLDVATGNTASLALNRLAGRPEADQVKVIWTSPTLPEDPIIWRKDLDPAVKEKLRQFFFTYARGDTPDAQRQRENLKPLSIGGFEPADDNHLLIVREVEAREKFALAKWSGDQAKADAAKAALQDIVAQRQAFEGRIGAQAGTQ